MEPIPLSQNAIDVIDDLECTSKKNNVKPLIPKIHDGESPHDDNDDNDDDKSSRKNELLSRLFYALSNLKKYDGDKDSSWCPDLSSLNIKENSASKETKLPGHVEENIKGIKQSANEYIQKLEDQLKDLDTADQRIEENVNKVLNDIDLIYQNLMDEICREINKKRELLRLETEIHKNEALVPLKACRQEVQAQINSARQLIDSIETMLNHPQIFNRDRLGKIVAASVNIGRIPAVPYPEELPYINFNRPKNFLKHDIIEKISELGCVMRVGPAQILEVAERPAGLFVTWHLADPEYVGEAHTFIVQKADGEVFDIESDKFETVYEGSEMYCFIRDLPINKLVTLRIRVLATDTAWSAFKIARTTIPAYSWGLENKNYMVTNDGKIIAKITNNISTIFSQGPQFDVNHIIEFKFLETSQDAKDDEGIALVHDPQGDDDVLKRNKSLLITPRGKIFMDGEEKLMKLPRIRFGTKVIFTATRKDADTLRINIECSEKCVTYDWNIQTPLYFAARFTEYNKWNLMVK